MSNANSMSSAYGLPASADLPRTRHMPDVPRTDHLPDLPNLPDVS